MEATEAAVEATEAAVGPTEATEARFSPGPTEATEARFSPGRRWPNGWVSEKILDFEFVLIDKSGDGIFWGTNFSRRRSLDGSRVAKEPLEETLR